MCLPSTSVSDLDLCPLRLRPPSSPSLTDTLGCLRAVQTETAKFPLALPKPSPIRASASDGAVASLPPLSGIEVCAVTEAELKENGFRSPRRTKLVCTIGPVTCGFEQMEALSVGGMNVARINMFHGTREWHRLVIERVRRLNQEKGFAVAIMMDTEGSEIHMGDLGGAPSEKAEDGEIWTFTVRAFDAPRPERTITVNYDGFAEDVNVGDALLVDGGMVRFEVVEKIGPDVKCQCTDPGLLLPRANLTFWRDGTLVRERNAMLPTISSKRKQSAHVLPDLGDDEKMKESGFIIPQEIPSHSWIKRGLEAAPTRYGIKPGRHWDGVDRGEFTGRLLYEIGMHCHHLRI